MTMHNKFFPDFMVYKCARRDAACDVTELRRACAVQVALTFIAHA